MLRILVIEDTPANLSLVGAILESAGHLMLGAVDAASGIALARREKPDLILMDIQLPGQDGLAATRELKGDALTRSIPVVALTAQSMKGDRERALEAGCAAYLAKPFNYRELLSTITRLCP
ncbi:response regulator [Roseateles violae]|uniref:Response regulator n=1 Tax=Roseateles violae TaxID=3058042 RepID=A0ABT8DU86_9BURK|nr:response regulator [Pelomonas sp. PFR6]MDN3921742.1 response regulator [Pelomonas sp. PFR6]